MSVKYTNRKGVTYYLCQGMTKTGQVRYHFAREPKSDSPDQIPEGFRISESVNGKVYLVKDLPQIIFPEELAIVEKAIGRHFKKDDYRADIKKDQIVIYERLGPDVDALASLFGGVSRLPPDKVKKILDEQLGDTARYNPIMRFILKDRTERIYIAERWSFLGDIDDWIDIGASGKLDDLARELIPKLDTDDFYDLF